MTDLEAQKIVAARSPEDQRRVKKWRDRETTVLKMKKRADGSVYPNAPDIEVFAAKLSALTGTADYGAAIELVGRTADCLKVGDGDRRANLVLAGLEAIGPRDGVEGMLAAQMIATHYAALRYLSAANGPEHAGVAVKLLRTFTAQTEALGRYRNGGRQQVIVQHQHVAVNAQQAAVAINAPTPALEGHRGAAIETRDQPHAIEFAPQDLRSQDALGGAVPLTGNAERSLPDARRRKSRSTNG